MTAGDIFFQHQRLVARAGAIQCRRKPRRAGTHHDYVIDLFHVFAHKSPLLFLVKCSFSAYRLANIVSIAHSPEKYNSVRRERVFYRKAARSRKLYQNQIRAPVLLLKPKNTQTARLARHPPLSHKTKEALSASRKSLSFFTFYCTSCAVYAQRTHLKLI